jgi:hypothetical protein
MGSGETASSEESDSVVLNLKNDFYDDDRPTPELSKTPPNETLFKTSASPLMQERRINKNYDALFRGIVANCFCRKSNFLNG